ncbi:hypothetical protein Vadar_003243 [Vaccinium darrowii]|uniref:Uncharacterized protein n=1 Tax=Vaccinium darrowii TaxID=229202 RepID=A0ACB7ZI68_9ERIC|nr:hypothetical protein Vadar_003243 [Vaccinium darrowii]
MAPTIGDALSSSISTYSLLRSLYVPQLARIVLKDGLRPRTASVRPYAAVSTVKKTTITTRILQLIHQMSLKNIHVTKRDLFYSDFLKLFPDQTQSDSVLDDVSCILGCTRSSLNVVAAEKGVVVGRLIFSDNGDMIDCMKMGMGGKAIPPNIDHVGGMKSDALFILLVEKDAASMRVAEDRFYNQFPCIIVTAKGNRMWGLGFVGGGFVKKNPGWVEELTLMMKTKQKAEIQALSSFGFQYLSEVYLPLKLQQKDWL